MRRAQALLLIIALVAAGLTASPAAAIASDPAATAPAAQSAAAPAAQHATALATTADNVDTSSVGTVNLTAAAVTDTAARLTITGHTDAWYYEHTTPVGGACTTVNANTGSVALTGLTPATTYVYKAYRHSTCRHIYELASVSFTTDGIALSAAKLITPEAGSATYTVALATVPTAAVTLTLNKATGDDADIAFDTDTATTGDQTTLTFTTTDWNTPQTVTVNAAADDNNDTAYGTSTITHTAISADSAYNTKTAYVVVTEGDDDVCPGTTAVGGSGVTTGGLVDDCNNLLALKANLVGTSTALNGATDGWKTTTAISSWKGVTTANGRVTELWLGNDDLSGQIPNTLGNLTNLTWLHLGNNGLSGPIPGTLGNLGNLTSLSLYANGLSGSIPGTLGNLGNLTRLYLYGNGLSGSIPGTLGNLGNLEELVLSGNGLSGSIPGTLGNLSNLTRLYLYGNGLSGSIPGTLGNLGNLEDLDLSDNGLSGSIPGTLGNLSNLEDLDLSDNGLSGSIPGTLGNLSNLTRLYLYGNGLSGSIPGTLGNLGNLVWLYLRDNGLSGRIPDTFGNLTIQSLDLSDNGLSGCYPANLVGFDYDSYDINPQRNSVTLAPCRGLAVSDASVDVPENSTATYKVKLSVAPTADVAVTLTKTGSNIDADITIDTDTDTGGNQNTLTFTTGNWAIAQTVTLAAKQDSDNAHGTTAITHTATSTDSDYDNLTATITAQETDDDPYLAADYVTHNSADLTLNEYSNWFRWWLKRTAPASVTCTPLNIPYRELTSLNASTAYTYTAYSNSTCTTAIDAETFTTLAPPFTAGSVTGNSAILNLTGYSGSWWLKRTDPASTTCTPKNTAYTHNLTSLDASTDYTYKAYSDSACTAEIATRTFTTPATAPALTAGSVTHSSAILTLTGYSGSWWLKRTTPASATCTPKSSTYHSLTSLNAGTTYTYKAYSDSACTAEIAIRAFTTPAALTAGSVTHSSAILTLAGYSGSWWLKRTTPASTTCTPKSSTYHSLTSLDAGTTYTYKAYSDSACTAEIATRAFTTPALTAGSVTHSSAILTLTGYSGSWWLKRTTPASTTCTPKNTAYAHSLANLDASTTYMYKAYSDSACTAEIATRAFTTTPSTLTATNVTRNSATLTLTNHTGSWWVKRSTPASTACTPKNTAYTHSLTSLDAGTTYTYKAYSDSACAAEIATRTFTTPAPALTAGSVTHSSAILTLTGHSGSWWVKRTDPASTACTLENTAYAHSLASLDAGTTYTYKAYSDSACAAEIATRTFNTTPAPSTPPPPRGGTGGSPAPPPPLPVPPPPVPPPPHAQSNHFVDIAGNAHRSAIVSIAGADITRGCAPALFCPSTYVTRAQMAAFLARALKLPESSDTQIFADIAGNAHRSAIVSIAGADITRGCAPALFCPSTYVTRAQMAAFLARALKLPESSDTQIFADIAGNAHRSAIVSIAGADITRGCAPALFCPSTYVTRAQMAAFLARALKL